MAQQDGADNAAEAAPPVLGRSAPTDESRPLAVGDLMVGLYCDGEERFHQVTKVTPRQVVVRRICASRKSWLPIRDSFQDVKPYTATRFGRSFAYNNNQFGPMWREEWPTEEDRARAIADRDPVGEYSWSDYKKAVSHNNHTNRWRATEVRDAELADRKRARLQ